MGRIFVLIVMLLAGGATSQLPEFSQQYRQRLGGAIDALSQVVAEFERDASSFGLTTSEAIDRLGTLPDAFARQRAQTISSTLVRLDRLKAQQIALTSAAPFERIGVFLAGMDPELARATAGDYEPAVPITAEGFLSAGLGGLAGLLLGRGCLFLGRLRIRRRTAP
ncbi:hypothetical protein GCM10011316_00090 [Roseibium aquae]|uniref:DUF2937 family protein n=1 Tax=Roseibium aquae TaxID=1323746 RepID=A0A916T527_9HYPH|nr:DUF2937 family protein [Roseibium aquae]GGB32004.1 hypothetical protein GCM10011316_00090 [Roseibium aquae]